eukprot:TRINITY_DN45176_c0_g1_i1.p3 TRINITY_DN45176_c0_g1~~TRINITY_DN45176_c0_g1_i1.p3  ORF type:complete len:255 (-),score=5.38 TRINITY_DN45176_c0_g1_i1:46-810(-)
MESNADQISRPTCKKDLCQPNQHQRKSQILEIPLCTPQKGRKPNQLGEKILCCSQKSKTRRLRILSNNLDTVDNKLIGLQPRKVCYGLPGLGTGITIATFHIEGWRPEAKIVLQRNKRQGAMPSNAFDKKALRIQSQPAPECIFSQRTLYYNLLADTGSQGISKQEKLYLVCMQSLSFICSSLKLVWFGKNFESKNQFLARTELKAAPETSFKTDKSARFLEALIFLENYQQEVVLQSQEAKKSCLAQANARQE